MAEIYLKYFKTKHHRFDTGTIWTAVPFQPPGKKPADSCSIKKQDCITICIEDSRVILRNLGPIGAIQQDCLKKQKKASKQKPEAEIGSLSLMYEQHHQCSASLTLVELVV